MVCHFVAPSASEPSRKPCGTARSDSSLAVMITGRTMNASVNQPASSEMFQPKPVNEEADAEEAEDDGGHAGEIDDGQPDGADDRPLAAVFAEVDGAEDAEDERDGHRADDQQDRADDLRPDAARGVVIRLVIGDLVGD